MHTNSALLWAESTGIRSKTRQYRPQRHPGVRASRHQQLLAAFSTADKVGPLTVFNIAGNKYRLVAALSFKVQVLWVKAVLTHVEYDKGKHK